MKMSFKKALGLGLCFVLAMTSFVGCGTKEASNNSTVFKVGGIGPTTGGAAVYGQAVKNGIELAFKEINENGGVNGCTFELNFQDDEHDAEKSVNAYNSLKDWKMQLLIGTVTSTPCKSVAPEAANDKTFLLTPSGSAVECIADQYAFRVCFSDPNQGIASADYISEHKVASKVAVIYNSSDIYSSGIYEKFANRAKEVGIEIVAAEAFTDDSKTDFTVQLQKAKDANAELVFLPIYYQEAALILQQANKMGYAPKFFGCDGLDGILTSEGFDASLAEGVMLLTPFAADATDSLTKNFVSKFQTAYGEIPNQFAADGYDAAYILKAAIEKANVKANMSNEELAKAIAKAMTEIEYDGVTGENMTWTSDGEPNKAPKAVIISDGAYKAM